MKRFHVYLVGHWHAVVSAQSVEAAEAVALAEAEERWPDLSWTSDIVEEEL